MDLSVIIVSWNTKKLLDDCIKSIFKYTKELNFEVIVIDNGSTDGSPQMIKAKFAKVILIKNKDNLGFTKANNQGIKAAKGDYIVLLNSDAYLIENAFKTLLEAAKSKNSKAVLAPLLLNENRTIQQSVGFFPNLPQVFLWMSFLDDLPLGQFFKPYHVDHDSFYKKEKEVDWLTGAAMFLPKGIITNAGLLNEEIFMYGEDVEWCFRIKKAGYKIFLCPQAKIVHIGRGSSKKIPTKAFVGEYLGVKFFYKQYKGFFALQIARFFLKIGALLRIIVFSILGRKELAKSYVEAFKVA
jgi:hypothetical protein